MANPLSSVDVQAFVEDFAVASWKEAGACVLAVSLLAGLELGAAAEENRTRVQLHNGATLEGHVLLERPDRLVLDLGFTALNVPKDTVLRLASTEQVRSVPQSKGLYQSATQRPLLTVTENVAHCAEAVLRVRTPVGLGSGFAIHPQGYVITNHHVIDGEYDISLTLFQEAEHELRSLVFENVRIVALAPHLDLALLKIEDPGNHALPTVPLGDSDIIGQGQTVFSIGSPLGFDRTVSQGIVSLKNRLIDGHLFVQSTVQINPGNSGGPLFNLRGEVIGVNNMKIGAVGIEGLSFAIPSNAVKAFLDNADAFAFDARNANNGHRYNAPPATEAVTPGG